MGNQANDNPLRIDNFQRLESIELIFEITYIYRFYPQYTVTPRRNIVMCLINGNKYINLYL